MFNFVDENVEKNQQKYQRDITNYCLSVLIFLYSLYIYVLIYIYIDREILNERHQQFLVRLFYVSQHGKLYIVYKYSEYRNRKSNQRTSVDQPKKCIVIL